MSILTTIQQQCADQLQADPLFASVTVLTERIKDLQSEITRALGPLNQQNGKSGLVIIVRTPVAEVNFENVFGPFLDEIKIAVRIVENVAVNQDSASGTTVAAADAAERACQLLHHFQPESANGPVSCLRPAIVLAPDPEYVCYECHFRTSGGFRTLPPQVAAPAINETAGMVTLTCATAGAAIFYTLDGSSASPRNGVLYTAPFTPGGGLTLNARAWLAGYLASNPAAATT